MKRGLISLLNNNCLISSNDCYAHVYMFICRYRLFCALLVALSFMFIESPSCSAQSMAPLGNESLKDTNYIVFPGGSIDIMPNYKLNKVELGKIDALLGRMATDSTLSKERLLIIGYASPEGSFERNDFLARIRTEQMRNYISAIKGLSPERIVTRYVSEDWKGVASFAEKDTTAQLPHREIVLEVAQSNIAPDEKERILRSSYPKDFRYLLMHCMPTLRRTTWGLEYKKDVRPDESLVARPDETLVVIGRDETLADTFAIDINTDINPVMADEAIVLEQVDSAMVAAQERRPFYLMLKTNLLYDVAAIPNVGVELSLGRRWSVTGEWMYAWWKSDRHHRYWQGYGGYLGVRKYFGKTVDGHPFTGHHIGVYGTALTYDIEWGGRGYQAAHYGFGGGVEYGYSMALARRLNLDFFLGLGFQDGEYKVYDPIDTHYVWQSTHKRNWWGPTKAGISLVWLIGRGNVHNKKGGQL